MKFEEKLMKLRKERALSQEELGEKLNVTRQTVSKWELGQSKPEMDKLIEISKFFGVSLEELTNDEGEVKVNEGPINTKDTKGNGKYIIIILVILGVLAVGLLITKLVGNFVGGVVGGIGDIFDFATESRQDNIDEFKNTFVDIIDTMENKIEEQLEQEKQEQVKPSEQEKQEQFNQQLNQLIQLDQMLQQYKGF